MFSKKEIPLGECYINIKNEHFCFLNRNLQILLKKQNNFDEKFDYIVSVSDKYVKQDQKENFLTQIKKDYNILGEKFYCTNFAMVESAARIMENIGNGKSMDEAKESVTDSELIRD